MVVQHREIPDAERHEVKGADSAVANHVLHSTGGGATEFKQMDYSNIANTPTIPTIPTIPEATYQADSTATDVAGLVADFNTLLGKLRDSGLMASS